MIFNVYTDTGNRLKGYFVPNGFTAEARIRVTGGGETLYVGPCDGIVDDLVRVGRHNTGRASFTLDTLLIEGLPEIEDLCIYDADSGFLIYRRNHPELFVQSRLFRLETTLAAIPTYNLSLMPHFAYGLAEVHLYGLETVSQLFHLSNYPSMYFEGRIHIKPHQRYLNEQILSVVSIEDPFVVLAMTLEGICQDDHAMTGQLEEREYAALLPLAGYFDGVDIGDTDRVCRHLKTAPKAIVAGLESPLIGLLTGQTPGVGGDRQDIPGALDILSLFDLIIIGTDAHQAHALLAQNLGLPPEVMPRLERPAHVLALAEALRTLSMLETVLESDLIAYYCLEQANKDAKPTP
jgi:hypothetical protein